MEFVSEPLCLLAPKLTGRALTPVSYTHLDVYKRQAKDPSEDRIEKNTCPMLVLPFRKIFVPSLVEIGPVV